MKETKLGAELVMFGFAATRAALDILENRPEVFEGRFRGNYLSDAKSQLEEDEARAGSYAEISPEVGDYGRVFVARPGESVYGLLYRISEELCTGLEADIFAIPVRQCAVELCECADLNPYLADSERIAILVAEDVGSAWEERGGSRIGRLRGDRQRFVRILERKSFLTPP